MIDTRHMCTGDSDTVLLMNSAAALTFAFTESNAQLQQSWKPPTAFPAPASCEKAAEAEKKVSDKPISSLDESV